MTTHTRHGRRHTKPQHGTESEYRRGCRCDECKRAMTEARSGRKHRADREKTIANVEQELRELQTSAVEAGTLADVDRSLYEAYIAARDLSADAHLSFLRAELELKRAVGSAELIRVDGRRVGSWSESTRPVFDSPAFRAKHAGLWQRFSVPRTFRRLVISQFAATPPSKIDRAAARRGKR